MPVIHVATPPPLPPRLEKLRQVLLEKPRTVKELSEVLGIPQKAVRVSLSEASRQYGLTIYAYGTYRSQYYMTPDNSQDNHH